MYTPYWLFKLLWLPVLVMLIKGEFPKEMIVKAMFFMFASLLCFVHDVYEFVKER